MQESHLNLREIIWEVTGRCNNGCKYCGSKSVWNCELDEGKIRKIVDEIAKFPPKEIDISGGDPLLVSRETHEYIVKVLSSAGVLCKILFNPKSLLDKSDSGLTWRQDVLPIFDLYTWMGVSINTEEELEIFEDYLNSFAYESDQPTNFTVISNFNLENVFIYGKIEKFVKGRNCTWQIQYTTYENEEDSLALYNNNGALEHFFQDLAGSFANGTKVVLADNLNNGGCGAGYCAMGILHNGDIVPCLSMRSWTDVEDLSQGNILENGLEHVWKFKFSDYRFACFKCCKDHCKNKPFCVPKSEDEMTDAQKKLIDGMKKLEEDGYIPPIEMPSNPPITVLYGVMPDMGGTYVYAVPNGWSSTTGAVSSYTTGGSISMDSQNSSEGTSNKPAKSNKMWKPFKSSKSDVKLMYGISKPKSQEDDKKK